MRSGRQQDRPRSKSPGAAQPVRAQFKEALSKLIQLDTRQQAMNEIKSIVEKNKTTSSLRVWLSVLSENRLKHPESEVEVLGFVVRQYGKGLLDPLDKIPSLEKTVFRVTQLLTRFFSEQTLNVANACRKTWLDLYLHCLLGEPTDLKKKLLYLNLEAMINGGAGRVAQGTAQMVLEGLIQTALKKDDLEFFKDISKRMLVLFMRTNIPHPATLGGLLCILSFFNINSLIPLLESILTKILSYIQSAPNNKLGYLIRSEACRVLALIGEQIDDNGLQVLPKVMLALSDLATDRTWTVQSAGRKALNIWNLRKKEWEDDTAFKPARALSQFQPERERLDQIDRKTLPDRFHPNQPMVQVYTKPQRDMIPHNPNVYQPRQSLQSLHQALSQKISPELSRQANSQAQTHYQQAGWQSQQDEVIARQAHTGSSFYPTPIESKIDNQTAQNFHKPQALPEAYRTAPNAWPIIQPVIQPSLQLDGSQRFLHKRTGQGGGSVLSRDGYYFEPAPPQESYAQRMDQIKKSIYRPELTDDELAETIPWEEGQELPKPRVIERKKQNQHIKQSQAIINEQNNKQPGKSQNNQTESDAAILKEWQKVLSLMEQHQTEEAVQCLLQMEDDLYLLRFLLKYSEGLLNQLTRSTTAKVLQRLLKIKKIGFVEHMLFKMVAESARNGLSKHISNAQNTAILHALITASKVKDLGTPANKLKAVYESSLK